MCVCVCVCVCTCMFPALVDACVRTETFTWSQPSISGSAPPVRWMHRAVVKDGNKVPIAIFALLSVHLFALWCFIETDSILWQMYVFAGTDENDYDDLHLLQWGSLTT